MNVITLSLMISSCFNFESGLFNLNCLMYLKTTLSNLLEESKVGFGSSWGFNT